MNDKPEFTPLDVSLILSREEAEALIQESVEKIHQREAATYARASRIFGFAVAALLVALLAAGVVWIWTLVL